MRAEVTWQPSLLDDGEPEIATRFGGLRRTHLDDRSWVDHCPGWLTGSDRVFSELAGSARWQQRTVTMWERTLPEPRLTAGWSTDARHGDAPAVIGILAAALSARYDVDFDMVWANLYRDGRDSVAWHGDRNRHVMTNPMVATVSLGAKRTFLLRPRGTTKAAYRFEPGPGDLIVMGGACQAEWEHTVPKTAKHVGARMSVTIRHSRPLAGERLLRAG